MNDKCAAIVQLGSYTHLYEGKNFADILNKIYEDQDLQCLSSHAGSMGTKKDREVADELFGWVCQAEDSNDMHLFDSLDFKLSIGLIRCHGWAQGEAECKALRAKY